MEGALILPYYNDTINQTWGKSGPATLSGNSSMPAFLTYQFLCCYYTTNFLLMIDFDDTGKFFLRKGLTF